MEAVNRSVPTHQDHECVVAGLGLWWREMAVEVSPILYLITCVENDNSADTFFGGGGGV